MFWIFIGINVIFLIFDYGSYFLENVDIWLRLNEIFLEKVETCLFWLSQPFIIIIFKTQKDIFE